MQRKSVVTFNHISKELNPDEEVMLKNWYHYYHKLCVCYRWKHKMLSRRMLALNVTSATLVVVGGIAGGITVNPIVLGCVSGSGLLIQTYMKASNLGEKKEMCKFAYTSFRKILTELRGYLRGIPYDDVTFLNSSRVIEDTVTDLCPPIGKLSARYAKTYPVSIYGNTENHSS